MNEVAGSQVMILPVAGKAYLCHVDDGRVAPVAEAPGLNDARYFPSYPTRRFAVVDSCRKRAGLFEWQTDPPRVQPILHFSTLPKDCIGHVALPFGKGMLVGGQSKSGEALWQLQPLQGQAPRQPVELPAKMKRPGKAIDGLHLDGDHLIAVDDIVILKWLLRYRIGGSDRLALERTIALPHHDTYERIISSWLGHDTLWLLSRGINHGRSGAYVWGLDRATLREGFCWSATEARLSEPESVPPALLEAKAIVEWNGELLVACGKAGLVRFSIGQDGKSSAIVPTNQSMPVPNIRLATVDQIHTSPHVGNRGVFVSGKSIDGLMETEWVPRSDSAI